MATVLIGTLLGCVCGGVIIWRISLANRTSTKPKQLLQFELDSAGNLQKKYIEMPKDYAPPPCVNDRGEWYDSQVDSACILQIPDSLSVGDYERTIGRVINTMNHPLGSTLVNSRVTNVGVNAGSFWIYASYDIGLLGEMYEPEGVPLTSQGELQEKGLAIYRYCVGMFKTGKCASGLNIYVAVDQPVTNVFMVLASKGLTNEVVTIQLRIPLQEDGCAYPFFKEFLEQHSAPPIGRKEP